jgi:hypothetical protein
MKDELCHLSIDEMQTIMTGLNLLKSALGET